jgi:UDP-3-O-[3-hydroxymyristoyl] glucosamine N-acyltransferase
MDNRLKFAVSAKNLASRLGLAMIGTDVPILEVQNFGALATGTFCFSKDIVNDAMTMPAVIIGHPGSLPGCGAILESANPRLDFARALQLLAVEPGFLKANDSAVIDPTAQVSRTAVLGFGVRIGARSCIGHNVVVADGVSIGADCIVKSNTVIGESGFGYERDESGIPIRILHLGSVVIGDRVELGSLNTICRGTLGNTVVESDVKTDDHVHIAHNCHIRRGALITACVELSGGVDVGEFAWIGPNSSVIQKVVLGNHVFIGIGSNVTKSVLAMTTVAGNPARTLSKIDK